MRDRAEETNLACDEVPADIDGQGPARRTPALFAVDASDGRGAIKKPHRKGDPDEPFQLPLPLQAEPEEEQPAATKKQRRKRRGGFVPVTRDPDVAQSYSDNVTLDYAVARGLAQALQSLPPEELAALKAKVAKAAQHSSKQRSARGSG